MDLLVGAVGDVHELLLRIAGEGDFPDRAVALGLGFHVYCFTKVPSVLNTWMRLLVRSQT